MFRIRPASFILVLAAALVVPATAEAEDGFFGAILHFFSGGASTPEPMPPAPPPGAPTPLDHFGLNNQSVPPSAGGPQVHYCVRTCDGRYFPLQRNAGGNAATAKVCGALCPTAETKVYSGSNIENAVASDGSRYANLKNAFVYRERLVEGCSCNGGDGTGNAAIDVNSDPTLRPGDIVVTPGGLMVFKGSKGATYQSSDFAPAASNARLSTKLRDKIGAIKIARPGGAPLASPQDFARGSGAAPAQAEVEPVSPAATAAQIFNFKDFDSSALRGSTAMGYNGRQ